MAFTEDDNKYDITIDYACAWLQYFLPSGHPGHNAMHCNAMNVIVDLEEKLKLNQLIK